MKFHIFKSRLIYKAKKSNKKVIMIPEQYTTQGCSNCGNINKNIGSSEIYKCKKCNIIRGRDINSAVNMSLKGLLS